MQDIAKRCVGNLAFVGGVGHVNHFLILPSIDERDLLKRYYRHVNLRHLL